MRSIAIFCRTLLKGGTEKQVLILSKILTDQKTDVFIINWCGKKLDPEYYDFIKDNSIRYFAIKGNYLSKFIQFLKILRDQKVSIILSYLTLPNFVSGLSRIFANNITRIGGIRNEKLPFIKFLAERWIHNNFNDATVFNNFTAKGKFIKKGFNPEKIYVIHNAILPIQLNGGPREKGSDIRIVTISRFVRQKDFITALNSFSRLIKKDKEKSYRYYLAGYGPGEKLIRSLSSELKIEDRIELLINPANIYEILTGCDIYLSTSLFEGLSNSIMEAMVAGLPIVATNVGDNKFLVRQGYNGFLLPPGDIEGIVGKLELLSRSEKMRKEYGKNSRTLVENTFSENILLENYLNLFKKFRTNWK